MGRGNESLQTGLLRLELLCYDDLIVSVPPGLSQGSGITIDAFLVASISFVLVCLACGSKWRFRGTMCLTRFP